MLSVSSSLLLLPLVLEVSEVLLISVFVVLMVLVSLLMLTVVVVDVVDVVDAVVFTYSVLGSSEVLWLGVESLVFTELGFVDVIEESGGKLLVETLSLYS